jgi:hypothetical protein
MLAALSTRALAQDTTPKSRDSAETKVAKLTNQLDATIVVGEWGEKTTLETVLAEIAARLPAGRPIPIEIDRAAFGPDLAKLLAHPVRLATFGERPVRDVLRDALRQVSGPAEAEYAVRPTGVVITRPRLALWAATYEVRNLLRLPAGTLARWATDGEPAPGSADAPTALVHVLVTQADLRPWETVRLVNKARLEVTATPGRHHDIGRLLESLRRMADLHVYMNARVYEVGRAFYTAEVATLFTPKAGAETAPAVVPVGGRLLQKLTRQTLVQEGDETKLRPDEVTTFLSRQTAFRYAAGPGKRLGSGLAGVSFAVRPEVSPDRRYLRLHLTQEVADLVAIDKGTALDPRTGRAVEVDVPNVRKTTVSGTFQAEDGGPFLMPVRYRPPGEGGDGKVWLLVARPMIWIEAEARERGPTFTPRSAWDWEVRQERVSRTGRCGRSGCRGSTGCPQRAT